MLVASFIAGSLFIFIATRRGHGSTRKIRRQNHVADRGQLSKSVEVLLCRALKVRWPPVPYVSGPTFQHGLRVHMELGKKDGLLAPEDRKEQSCFTPPDLQSQDNMVSYHSRLLYLLYDV